MLTFEKIREMERTERDTKKLQKLPEDVMEQIKEYLRRKERITEKSSADIIELENVKNTINRLFEMRETKITAGAIDTARTGIPCENLTKEEERTFFLVLDVLQSYRKRFFEELAKEPVKKEEKREVKPIYKVKKSLPEFVGPDMKIYKLTENELVELPKEVETLLLKEGLIEKVE